MPHKHKRVANSATDYNLPPTTIAKPLPVSKSASTTNANPSKTGPRDGKSGSKPSADSHGASKKRKRSKPSDDDTPKAFARLMAWQNGIKPKSGLDDGTQRAVKKRKTAAKTEGTTDSAPAENDGDKIEIPKILPGERMADFSARVDAALPLGKIASRGVHLEGVKRQRTKLEKKITRMQDEWRERDKRMKDKAAEEEEEAEIEAILNGEDGAKAVRILEDPDKAASSKKKKKKGKKGKRRKGGDESDDDPWAAVAKARKDAETGSTGLIGVHDVVQEPPKFAVKPKEKFKLKNGVAVDVANVPGASGSLRRREELGEARKNVLDGYRSARKGQRVSSS